MFLSGADRRSATAGQLVPQRRQCLVGRQRAGGLGFWLGLLPPARLAAVTAVGFGGLGPPRLRDLRLVRFVPRAGLGVLVLPLLALLVVSLEPLARLGVEAFGVDVVALLVVSGLLAGERGVQVLHSRPTRGPPISMP